MAIFAEFYLPQPWHHPAPACDTLSGLVVLVSGPFLVELTNSRVSLPLEQLDLGLYSVFRHKVPLDFRSGFTILIA